MNTWTPQTGKNGDGWKYQYFKKKVRGFQQAHQCSSWTNDYAVFSMMPETDSLILNEDKHATGFSHDNETVKLYNRSVKLDNNMITEKCTVRNNYAKSNIPESQPTDDIYVGIRYLMVNQSNSIA